LATVALVSLGGCEDGPTEVVFEVIEETQFAASLGIDLADFDVLNSGVYVKDVVVGTGEPAVFGTTPTVTYTGWLADGTQFDSGTFDFFMGNSLVVPGFEDGLLNVMVGGTRVMIIPPGRGYGGIPQVDQSGNVTIPGGSIMVFEITLDSVVVP
jgi:FKBP-type peptidyl-prolyl cis-trans isomerase